MLLSFLVRRTNTLKMVKANRTKIIREETAAPGVVVKESLPL
jgi:hypothetical protein